MKIKEIKVGENRRPINQDKVKSLIESINQLGLLNPITISKENKLIAGNHRLEAFKQLGKEDIDIIIVEYDNDLFYEMAEIDENLIRNELHWLDADKQLARRKQIYELIHPETKKNAIPHNGKSPNDIMSFGKSFVEDSSEKIGETKRSIERSIQRGNNIIPEIIEDIIDLGINKTDGTTIARLTPEDQVKVIEYVKGDAGINVSQAVKKIIKIEKKEARLNDINKQVEDIKEGKLPHLEGLFDVISIDCPWPYEDGKDNTYDSEGRRCSNPYPEMSIDEIKDIKLPLKDDAIVYFWTTQRFLPDAFNIIKHWGFEYKATLVWNKENIGMGYWFRMQAEFCLVCVKGKPYWNNTTYRDIFSEKSREHSRKPDSFFEMVNQINPGRKLEYFSREPRKGWELFGNEINKFNLI